MMALHRKYRWFYWPAWLAGLGAILALSNPWWVAAAVAVVGLVVGKVLFSGRATDHARAAKPDAPAKAASHTAPVVDERPPAPDERTIPGMLQQGRHAFVIRNRDKWIDHPDGEELLAHAISQLEATLGFVPESDVLIRGTLTGTSEAHDHHVPIEPFLIGAHTVTNAMYQHFVDGGGYENLDLWPEDILPLVLEFCDRSGELGPHYWTGGRFPTGQGNRPVVGICWYEAAAYARWIGQRLPNEAEWQMAANWRVAGSSKSYQRAYPWGEAMDHERCNIWVSGRGEPVDVDEYPDGGAPNDVRQLIGNVWEWTDSDFEIRDQKGEQILTDFPTKTIRGGAFDTFFESQASSEFRTGQNPLARKHNIGFRCALSADAIPMLVSA
jgi:iron(II)-dependent oxidoreductase